MTVILGLCMVLAAFVLLIWRQLLWLAAVLVLIVLVSPFAACTYLLIR